jgi:hypothetical protein
LNAGLRPKVSHLVPQLCGMPKRVRDERWLLILRAFFDETGTNPSADPALIMGGFLGQIDQWELASEAWDEYLKLHRLDFFSHRECHDDKNKMDFAKVISRFSLRAFCVYFPHKSIASRNANSTKSVVGSRPYDWTFLTAVETVLWHVEKSKAVDEVDFVFDHRNELDACIQAFYRMKREQYRSFYRYAGQCNDGDDKKVAGLQMGDLLAGEYSKCKASGKPTAVLDLLVNANGLVETLCSPSPAINSSISLDKVSRQLEKEFGACLKKLKGMEGDRRLPTEMVIDFNELLRRSAYHQLQIDRHESRLERDPNYGTIKRIIKEFRSRGDDEQE